MLNKPEGVVLTTSDELDRKAVLDLVKSSNRLFTVGRLDQGSKGLILLTDDGELTQRLTHPKFEVSKTYQVVVQGKVNPAQLTLLRTGVALKEGKTAPAQVYVTNSKGDLTHLWLTIHEGRNRQIGRMCGKLNLLVVSLKRVAFGPLGLGNLRPGEWCDLTG